MLSPRGSICGRLTQDLFLGYLEGGEGNGPRSGLSPSWSGLSPGDVLRLIWVVRVWGYHQTGVAQQIKEDSHKNIKEDSHKNVSGLH